MVSLKASKKGLEIVDWARRQKRWNRQACVWYETANTSLPTLKRFLQGEAIQADTFINICRVVGVEWKEIVDVEIVNNTTNFQFSQPNAIKDWGEAPDVGVFYGRIQELATLEQWILHDCCRVVTLLGMGGIGKTATSVKLVEQIQGNFDYFIWRSLRDAPPYESVLTNLISVLTPEQQTHVDVSQLINFLCQHRCLVIIDRVDAILCSGHFAGHFSSGYEGYKDLIRQVVETRELQSCLVLIGREKPHEVALLEDETLRVRSLLLPSLGEAANQIFQEKELLYQEESWQELIQMYGGNPLALKMISTTIKEVFAGNVKEYLKENTIVIGDKFLQILEQQFIRLGDLEKRIMYEMASYGEPISYVELQNNLSVTVPKSEIIKALQSLGWRSLIEKITQTTGTFFTLQPVIGKYIKRMYPQGM